jgi:DNA ligase-1
MKRLAALSDALASAPPGAARQRVLERYFRDAPDPDRGWALAAMVGALALPRIQPAVFRAMAEARVDPELFRLSHAFVGDVGETVALIWPDGEGASPGLPDVIQRLRALGRADRDGALAAMLDRLDASGRLALIRLCGGGMRTGVTGAQARGALARIGGVEVAEIDALWHGLTPPYADLFAWLAGGAAPVVDAKLAFRPMMLGHPLDEAALSGMDRAAFVAEVKWDGLRIEAASGANGRRLYARDGDDIGAAFPDLLAAMDWRGCVDGTLLVTRAGAIAPFADLQTRLNRKTSTRALLADLPAIIMVHDLLHDGDRDLRALPWHARRVALEDWFRRHAPARLNLSPVLEGADWAAVAAGRDGPGAGVMIKRRDAPYVAGRQAGQWLKWARAPLTANCVLIYAQRGRGGRSGPFAEVTFGAWSEGPDGQWLAPVGKAPVGRAPVGTAGVGDGDLARLDAWIRAHLTERFGPACGVAPELVLEVAFDGLAPSARRKSGVAMRGARILRIRWGTPAGDADRLADLRTRAGMDPR